MTDPRILLLGKNGQVGWALQRALAIHGPVSAHDRDSLNLEDKAKISEVIRVTRPRVIVNAAAYTAVDKAETDRELAFRINAEAPGLIAAEAKQIGALLVHYSTDYVFDGKKDGDYDEADVASPVSVYGRSKLAGEQAVAAAGSAHLIFRTSWVYGPHGGNFPKKILALAHERDTLRVVSDQTGAPTSADLIADVTAHCVAAWLANPADDRFRGLYHLVPAGQTSWHGLACEIVRLGKAAGLPLKATPETIAPIASADYPSAAQRPPNSRLSTAKLTKAFQLTMPPWQLHLERFISEFAGGRQ